MEHINQWQPGTSMAILRQRSRVLSELRNFFQQRQVIEVDVPLLSRATVTDQNIDSIQAHNAETDAYLQTSPEYFMKRLLASGSGDIYCLGKAFREAESGRRHNPEFTLLEWYRCGWDEHQLMDEVAELIAVLLPGIAVRRCSYADVFIQHLQVCLLYTSDAADEEDSVDLGGRRIIKKKKKREKETTMRNDKD